MSVSFDWDFREEKKDNTFWDEQDPPPPKQWPRWLRWGIVVLVLLIIAGLAARTWINNRLDIVKKAEGELREIVALELKSIADGDVELFRFRQDPAAFRWQDQQVDRYIYGPTPGGLAPAPGLTPADRPSEIEQVRVVGLSGRVKLVHWFYPLLLPPPYDTVLPDSLFHAAQPAPLSFHSTWFYRLDEDGTWYHTLPPDNYVGIPHSWHSTRFDVFAAKVEVKMLEPVILELFALMFDACRLLDCPQGEQYSLSFDDAPAPERHGEQWSLPALYLSGMPADPVTRDAWVRAIKMWLVESLAQAQAGRESLTQRAIYRQIVARLQAELGLIKAPVPDVGALTQTMRQGEQRPLWSLWQASYDPNDPQAARALESEVNALIQLIETQVGYERLFELIPALDDYDRFSGALYALYGLENYDFMQAWAVHIAGLTGENPVPGLFTDEQLFPSPPPGPPLPTLPPLPPGDQVALTCDRQILVGNLDWSNLVPLTPGNYNFAPPFWSPDGRWLLSAWQSDTMNKPDVPYLLAADGSQIRPLTAPLKPSWDILGWSPDGRQAHYIGFKENPPSGEPVTWAVEVETGQMRQLTAWWPTWSPDGRHVIYFDSLERNPTLSIWLADVDDSTESDTAWENARQITEKGEIMPPFWSPDSARLALNLYDQSTDEHTLALYELATEHLTTLVTLSDVTEAMLSFEPSLPTSSAEPAAALDQLPSSFQIGGWSADGSRLLIMAETESGSAVLVAPLDGSPLRVLALSGDTYMHAAWSPTDPDQLVLLRQNWSNALSYIFDLRSGPVYTTTQVMNATWSPDGAWVAFVGSKQITIVDRKGQLGSTLQHSCQPISLAWNPAADLTLPESACHAGRDLWVAEQDVHHVGHTLVVVVHNSGDQAVQGNLSMSVTQDQPGGRAAFYKAAAQVVPPCGGLLSYLDIGDLSAPLTLNINPPDEPDALPEDDYGNNQVTLYPTEP